MWTAQGALARDASSLCTVSPIETTWLILHKLGTTQLRAHPDLWIHDGHYYFTHVFIYCPSLHARPPLVVVNMDKNKIIDLRIKKRLFLNVESCWFLTPKADTRLWKILGTWSRVVTPAGSIVIFWWTSFLFSFISSLSTCLTPSLLSVITLVAEWITGF